MNGTEQIGTVLGSTPCVSKVPLPGTDHAGRLIGESHFQGSGSAGRRDQETGHRGRIQHGDARIAHHRVSASGSRDRQGDTVDSGLAVEMARIFFFGSGSVSKVPQFRGDDSGGGIREGDQEIVSSAGWRDIEARGRWQLLHLDTGITGERIGSSRPCHGQGDREDTRRSICMSGIRFDRCASVTEVP